MSRVGRRGRMPGSYVLRDDAEPGDYRYLEAYLDPHGDLVVKGEDQGRGVREFFGSDVEQYEWTWTVRATHLGHVRQALDLHSGDFVAELARKFGGTRAAEIERRLRDADVPVELLFNSMN